MRTRKLTLRRETLTELLPHDLDQVVGASGVSCNPALCLTLCSSCASDFQECMTGLKCLSVGEPCA